MKMRLTTTNGHRTFHDVIQVNDSPDEWIRRFNQNLLTDELPRKLIKAEPLGKPEINHMWMDNGGDGIYYRDGRPYRKLKCPVCGVTAKIYPEEGGRISMDHAYRKAIFRRCDTAKSYLDQQKENN